MSRFLLSNRFAPLSAAVAAALLVGSLRVQAQAPAADTQQNNVTLSTGKEKKRKGDDKVVQSKDTKAAEKKKPKVNPLADLDSTKPDKQLYDKAIVALNKGHFDVARLDLQTMLNTYPESEYQMRAKLAVADSWYKDGGSAALAQAEAEYKDFITFFPNAPEAAEAQMRVGDIYFRQMDKPDRDYAKAIHAQEEYRNMIQQFPQSTLVPQAKQRLREVQEVLATREASVASFYAGHENWAAAIARYQTIADTYPLYSGMDQVLIAIGDAYEGEVKNYRNIQGLSEGPKAKVEKYYDDLAMQYYTRVITEHSASPHVEDARDRIDALNRKQPDATPEQVAASAALENSRSQYKLLDIAKIMFLRRPDTVQTATIGEPTMADPRATSAPEVVEQANKVWQQATKPGSDITVAAPGASTTPTAPVATQLTPTVAAKPVTDANAAPLGFNNIDSPDTNRPNAGTTTLSPSPSPSAAGGPAGNGIGMEIVQPRAGEKQPSYGLKPVGGDATSQPLPAVEKPSTAEDTVNDVAGQKTPVAQEAPGNGKKAAKPKLDKSDESSSKEKKKKGLGKINPF